MIFRTLTWVLFYGYVAMLLGVGASGILIAPWELSRIFHVPLESLSSIELATMEAQYRFLKSMEMGFGVFAIAYRHDIFQSRKANAVFLTGVFAGVAARSLSFVLDGRPSGIFVAFLILELACGAAVFLVSRKTAVNP